MLPVPSTPEVKTQSLSFWGRLSSRLREEADRLWEISFRHTISQEILLRGAQQMPPVLSKDAGRPSTQTKLVFGRKNTRDSER